MVAIKSGKADYCTFISDGARCIYVAVRKQPPFVKKEATCFDNDRNVPKKIFVATKNVKCELSSIFLYEIPPALETK